MRTYTKREIAHLLNVSPRTVAEDVRALKLNPTKSDRGLNLYSQRDFNLISQMRHHCQNKVNTRESFVPNTEVEILDIEPSVSLLTHKPHHDKYQVSMELGLSQDPLFDLELLQRISDRAWLLPSARLAPLLNLSPGYLNQLKQYNYCGFIATKEIYAHNKALWKIQANNS